MDKTRFEKKLKIFLTLTIFDLDWGLALSHRNAMRHPRSRPVPFPCDQNRESSPSLITSNGRFCLWDLIALPSHIGLKVGKFFFA